MKKLLHSRHGASKGAALIIVLALVVLVTGQGPTPTPAPSAVIGRYAFAVYDEGGLVNMNLGGFPTYAGLTRPTLPGRATRPVQRLPAKYPSEESEIMLAAFTPNPPC